MALTVNTNIASLTAQRNLTGSQSMLSTSLERLSSGLRINSAKDDAAGLAISERFTAQIRGLNQGIRNANDGISLAQTAEGALKEVTSNLQRIRELAVQSANATNSDTDRASLQVEVGQLVAEIERVATTTTFNGINLLDGTFTSKAFQVGPNSADTVSITTIASAKTEDIGSSYSSTFDPAVAAVSGTALAGTDIAINNVNIGASVSDGVSTAGDDGSALAIANAINSKTVSTGVTASASTVVTAGSAITYTNNTTVQSFTLNNVYIEYTESTDAATTAGIAIAAINAVTSQTGVVASRDSATGNLVLTAADGRNIVTNDNDLTDVTSTAIGIADGTYEGTLTYSSTSQLGIQFHTQATTVSVGGTPTEPADGVLNKLSTSQADYAPPAVSSNSGGLDSLSVATASNAALALASVDSALDSINSSRANLGAYQNRFESVVANLQTTAENLSASRSRIVDADFASETAQLTKAQILQQSGIAMLAQANAIPQNVLALLQ